jgi:hypothetical protein
MNRFLPSIGAGVLAFAVAACASDSSTAPNTASLQLTAADSASLIVREAGDATSADIAMINSVSTAMSWDFAAPNSGLAASMMPADNPAFAQGTPNGCTLNAITGRFDCTPFVNANGLTVTRSIAFFDANGVMMNHFDSTTASMNVQATDVGVVARDQGADTVSRTRNLTASGLLGHNTTRQWDGSATGTGSGYYSDSAATRTYNVNNSSTFAAIIVDLPRSANPWPASGSIARQVNGSGTVTKNGVTKSVTISRSVTITFNGTEFVPMTVGSVNYTLDLATGKATKN